jgi:2-dehydro-3-deoxyphosphooctonate aldolase (KDO 8-P synthase)
VFDRPVGRRQPIFLIAGPCVIESRENALSTAARLAEIAQSLGLLVIYKSSFDKGNRSSGNSYRGPGLEEGLRILDDVSRKPVFRY